MCKVDGEPSCTPSCCVSGGMMILAPKLSVLSVNSSCIIVTTKL